MRPPRERVVRWGLCAIAVALVVWVRALPGSPERVEDVFRYRGPDAREHVYLGDHDSYLWLRQARSYLRSGTVCEGQVGGECRDVHGNAPVGRLMPYPRSLHVAAIVALHRVVTVFSPAHPLEATAFWVPVLIGGLAVLPAFAIGARLAGPMGGLVAALVTGLDPVVLSRTMGSDNDVWNVALPLLAVWAALAGVSASSRPRRAGGAALAGILVGLHAAVWSGWVFTGAIVGLGLLALLGLALVRALAARPRGGAIRAGRARDLAVALLIFAAVGGLGAAVAGAGADWADLRVRVRHLIAPRAEVSGPALWPSTLATVGELARLGLWSIGESVGGNVRFFVAWLGLLALVLPRRRWEWHHFALLAAGNVLYYFLLVGGPRPAGALIGLMALPLALGLLIATLTGRLGRREAAAALVAVWFLAALHQALQGYRFVLLLVPPLGIAAGVAVGRLYEWLAAGAARRVGRRAAAVRVGLFAVMALILLPTLQSGLDAARRYRPGMHDAWWDALTEIRDTTPANAIVDTWWDYGHWVAYVADRRVSADGASLRTHVPYWTGRALLAPSAAEAAGLLRMLNCGSDAAPLPEGRRGAFGKLVALGMAQPRARDVVAAVAGLDRAGARAYLAGQGLEPAAVDDVLASTHCAPPPAYLVLSSDLARLPKQGWAVLGSWDHRRAYAARVAARLPPEAAVADLVRRLGVSEAEAERLHAGAAALRGAFAAPAGGPLSGWWPCADAGEPGTWTCPVGRPLGEGTAAVFEFVPGAPERSRLVPRASATPAPPRAPREIPVAVLVAGAHGVREAAPPAASELGLGALVDVAGRRVLIGPPSLLRSTFVALMYLDGRHTDRFEKVDERIGARDERVVTWRLREAPGS